LSIAADADMGLGALEGAEIVEKGVREVIWSRGVPCKIREEGEFDYLPLAHFHRLGKFGCGTCVLEKLTNPSGMD
jgi:hypothetical protein